MLVVVVSVTVLLSIAGTVASRATEMSRRRLCMVNLKTIATASRIYASDNRDRWPVAAFRDRIIGSDEYVDIPIDYVNNTDDPFSTTDPGAVGYLRSQESTSRTDLDPKGGSTALSNTRHFWLLVRSGDVPPERFICPSSGDAPDPALDVNEFYDFSGYRNISYGYRVAFGPLATLPGDFNDPRMVLAADKSPFYLLGEAAFQTLGGDPIEAGDAPLDWQPFNSPNHAGAIGGEGQNMVFVDGHIEFRRRPTGLLQDDNVFTLMTDDWVGGSTFNRTHGHTVHQSSIEFPFPGEGALPGGFFSSTDSLIYP